MNLSISLGEFSCALNLVSWDCSRFCASVVEFKVERTLFELISKTSNVAELMNPPTPGELGPLKDSNKRVLTEEDVAKLRADSDKKRAEDAKKAQEAEAKAEKDAQAVRDAHAKIDAEAEKKMALAK